MACFPSSPQIPHRVLAQSRPHRLKPWLALMLCISFHADACETVDESWCSGQLVEAVHFELTGPQLRMLAGESPDATGPLQGLAIDLPNQPEIPPSCGSVNRHGKKDPWQCMSDIVQLHCQSLVTTPKGPIPTKPVIAGPATAIDDSHHATYSLEVGVYGACLICAESADGNGAL